MHVGEHGCGYESPPRSRSKPNPRKFTSRIAQTVRGQQGADPTAGRTSHTTFAVSGDSAPPRGKKEKIKKKDKKKSKYACVYLSLFYVL